MCLNLIANRCVPRGGRSVAGVDVDPDLVHMEMQETSGGMTRTCQCVPACACFLHNRGPQAVHWKLGGS